VLKRTNDWNELDAAINLYEQGVQSVTRPPAGLLLNLAHACFSRFLHGGGDHDIDQAIDRFNEVLDNWPPMPRDPYHEHILGVALLARYEREQDVDDLTSMIDAYERGLKSTAPDHLLRSAMESNLGIALRNRFQRRGAEQDLMWAIETDHQAVRTAKAVGQPDIAYRNELGIALRVLAEHTVDDDLRDALLERAIALGEESVAASEADNDPRSAAARRLSLAGTMRTKFAVSRDIADLNQAINLMNDARRQLPEDHFDRATVLTSLGGALQIRARHSPINADLTEALGVFREAAAVGAAPLLLRTRAALQWGRTAALLQRWTDAVEGYSEAVNNVALVMPRGLSRVDQESLLVEFAELGTEGAAACLADNQNVQKERAVELFEQGRAVLFSQILDTRSDLTDLREADPDLASEFERCVDILDTPEPSPTVLAARKIQPLTATDGRDPDLRRNAWRELREILDRIRSDPRFNRFLLPRLHDELLTAGAHGPVVLINVGEWSSDALIMDSGDSKVVPLEGVSPHTVEENVNAFIHARSEIFRCLQGLREKSPEPDLDVKCTRARKALDAVLSWLGERITGPVLDELGYCSRRSNDAPRIWWCPAGLLSLLPLHAARHTTLSGGTDEVIDRVISSSTPTLRALLAARGAGDRVDAPALLAVAMPDELPHTAEEAASLARHWPGQVRILGLPSTEPALCATVKDNISAYSCVHFACHGAVDFTHPSESCLELADGPLTVTDLTARRLPHGELVFLSACTTALPGQSLPNEPIHLAGACQLAGFRQVIASLWEINDEYAADLAKRFYMELQHITATAAGRATAEAAQALHDATLAVRDDGHRFRPEYWAAFIHVGE
jgi:tetratricopeptide (TPR) repeat protein